MRYRQVWPAAIRDPPARQENKRFLFQMSAEFAESVALRELLIKARSTQNVRKHV